MHIHTKAHKLLTKKSASSMGMSRRKISRLSFDSAEGA